MAAQIGDSSPSTTFTFKAQRGEKREERTLSTLSCPSGESRKRMTAVSLSKCRLNPAGSSLQHRLGRCSRNKQLQIKALVPESDRNLAPSLPPPQEASVSLRLFPLGFTELQHRSPPGSRDLHPIKVELVDRRPDGACGTSRERVQTERRKSGEEPGCLFTLRGNHSCVQRDGLFISILSV
ncbi:hypothetical protein AOLI_G00244430 [Acnodon oligacanthus]